MWSSSSAPGPTGESWVAWLGTLQSRRTCTITKILNNYVLIYILNGSLVSKLPSCGRMVMVSLHNHHVNHIIMSTASINPFNHSIPAGASPGIAWTVQRKMRRRLWRSLCTWKLLRPGVHCILMSGSQAVTGDAALFCSEFCKSKICLSHIWKPNSSG